MCGIVAVVRRPGAAARRPTRPTELLAARRSARRRRPRRRSAVDRRPAPPTAVERRQRRLLAEADGCCGAPPASARSSATGACSPSVERPGRLARRRRSSSSRAASTPACGRGRGRRAWRRSTPRSSRLKDAAVGGAREDRLRTARAVADLAGREPGWRRHRGATRRSSWRCRPSTGSRCGAATRPGCTSSCADHGLDLDSRRRRRAARPSGPTTRCSAPARCASVDGSLCFVYKAAAEIGELGDNTAALRERHPRRRPAAPGARAHDGAVAVVLGHTRWASVGIISEPNAHPLNSTEEAGAGRAPTWSPPSTATSTTSPT